jgi:hypothetical protein
VELEVARADRHLHAVTVAARLVERAGERRLGHAVEAEDAPLRRRRPRPQTPERLGLEHARPQLLELARRAGKRDRGAVAERQHDRRSRPDEPDPLRAGRQRRLLADARLEVGVRPPEALGDAARALLDRREERLVDDEPDPGGTREQLDGPVVVRGTESAGDDEQLVAEPLLERREEVGFQVADDGDAGGLNPEPAERLGEEWAVPVVSVAADELRARRDDRGARPGQRPRPESTRPAASPSA